MRRIRKGSEKNMAEKEILLTLEGLKKLEEELEQSKTVKRGEVATG